MASGAVQAVAVALLVGMLSLAALGTSFAGEAHAAARLSKAIQEVAGGGARCEPRQSARVVMCIVNATERNADLLANGIVFIAAASDLDLRGWKVTLVTLDDYVVTMEF